MSTQYSRARFGAAIVVAFVCGLVFASGFDLTRFGWAQSRVTSGNKPSASQVASAAETETAFEAVADHARPAVVSIEVKKFAKIHPSVQPHGGRGQPPPQDPLRDLFRQFGQPEVPSDRPEEASGSGFIVTSDGYILTNNHVVADVDRVTVTLLDKRQFDAKVVGADPTTDVAVIKIDAKDLPTLPLGDDANARIGQWVLAIGNPLGLNFTVTAGIVSAKGRNQPGLLNPTGKNPYAISDYIQTDAAINPGNSGGPLLNIHGDVIGINSAIASGTGYYAGYGFAVPITLAKQVMDDLIKYGRIRRAILGVVLTEVTPSDATAAGLAEVGGAKVDGFNPETGPAEKAGLEIGDIIVSAASHPIDQVNTLQRIIRGFKPGDVVDLDVMRFGQKKSFRVTLGEPSQAQAIADNSDAASGVPVRDNSAARQFDKLGITVGPVSSEFMSEFKLTDAEKHGLQISKVGGSGPAYRQLFPTEVIFSELYPSKRAIGSASDLEQALSPLKSGDVIEFVVCSPDPNTRTCQTSSVSVRIGN